MPRLRSIIAALLGFALLRGASQLEMMGDLKYPKASDVPPGFLSLHHGAIALLVLAVLAFLYSIASIFLNKPPAPEPEFDASKVKRMDIYPENREFDPDAVIKRYVEEKSVDEMPAPPVAPRAAPSIGLQRPIRPVSPGGFGKKPV